MIEVPKFTKGEPGFTAKLNELADAVRELQAAAEEKPKRAPRTKAADAKASDPDAVGGLSE